MDINYDRASDLRSFDATKAGVKGLVDSNITKIPLFFHRNPDPDPDPDPDPKTQTPTTLQIPIIDLQHLATNRPRIAQSIKEASETLGFFQVINHGIADVVLDEMLEGVRRFNELGLEVKREYYSRDAEKKVRYYSNFDLFRAPFANWRDSVFCVMAPKPPRLEEVPLACREITFEYSHHVEKLGNVLFELLSEALGLNSDHLKEMECAKGHALVSNYYPPCPEPNLTLGTSKHSDPDFLTILLQDQIGGLQILYQNQWVDVPSVRGALVVNIGDLLQLMSNDKFKSVEHRVLANSTSLRVSVACFFTMNLSPSSMLYGPIKELLSEENPPLYGEISLRDFIEHYDSKGLDGQSALNYFRL